MGRIADQEMSAPTTTPARPARAEISAGEVMEMGRMLTVKEAAKRANRSDKYIYAALHRPVGNLPYIPGGKYLIDEKDLDGFLEREKVRR